MWKQQLEDKYTKVVEERNARNLIDCTEMFEKI